MPSTRAGDHPFSQSPRFLHVCSLPGLRTRRALQVCDLAMTFHPERHVRSAITAATRRSARELPAFGRPPVLYQGIGTEKLNARDRGEIPGFAVQRMDSDTMSRPGSHQNVLSAFREAGEIHILVGTQMIAKGLDFPNVTLVGVVNADVGLHLPDFRAERTFQLLAQVAGRMRAAAQVGCVYIQTMQPEHPSIALAANHDYLTFAKEEMAIGRPRISAAGADGEAGGSLQEREGRQRFRRPPVRRLPRGARPPQGRRRTDASASWPRGVRRYSASRAITASTSSSNTASSAVLHQVFARRYCRRVRVGAEVDLTVDIDPQDML